MLNLGTIELPNAVTEFVSMHRVNYENGWDAGRWAAAGSLFLPNFKGTPGAANSVRPVQDVRTASRNR